MKPGREWPGVGVGAVVYNNSGDSLLMVERAGAHGAGTWSVPGGWVEMWESPFDAAAREVSEETGIKVLPIRSEGWTEAQHHEDGVHAVTLWIRCIHPMGQPRVMEPDKCPRAEWVSFSEVHNRSLFAPFDEWWQR